MNEFFGTPVFGLALTIGIYVGAAELHKRVRWAHPLFTTFGGLLGILWVLPVQPGQYEKGGDIIALCLGPATVALGVPMFKQAQKLKERLPVLATATVTGALVGMITAGVTAKLLGAPQQVVMSAVPKSVTTPIAMEVSRQLHGVPEITAAMAMVAGIMGSLIGPQLLKLARVRHEMAMGAAMGTASHALGTARALKEGELQGSTASLAMAMAGIATALMAMAFPWAQQVYHMVRLRHGL